jgi:predicted nuclease with TOPRIM domain
MTEAKESLKETLNNLQQECNKLYEECGLIEEVMDLQLVINSLRNKFDLVDSQEIVYENFVQ